MTASRLYDSRHRKMLTVSDGDPGRQEVKVELGGARGALLAELTVSRTELCELAAAVILRYGSQDFLVRLARVITTRHDQGILRRDLPRELTHHGSPSQIERPRDWQ